MTSGIVPEPREEMGSMPPCLPDASVLQGTKESHVLLAFPATQLEAAALAVSSLVERTGGSDPKPFISAIALRLCATNNFLEDLHGPALAYQGSRPE